jgi:hypothetical protein
MIITQRNNFNFKTVCYTSGSQPVGRDPLVGHVALPGGSWMLPQKAKKMIEVFFVGLLL